MAETPPEPDPTEEPVDPDLEAAEEPTEPDAPAPQRRPYEEGH